MRKHSWGISMDSKVSVIVPMYNSDKTIERTIKSVLRQTYINIEVIIVDDGSEDDSIKIVKNIMANDKRVILFRKKNGGVSSARNYGIRQSTGEYLFFLDADDEIEENLINSLLRSREKDTLPCCRMKIIDKNGSCGIYRKAQYCGEEIINGVLSNKIQGYACGCLFRNDKLTMFNEKIRYCEDMLFFISYIKNNNIGKLLFVDEVNGSYIYHQENSGTTRRKKGIIKNIESIQYAMKELDSITDYMYSRIIQNKKNALYEYELSRSDKNDIKYSTLHYPLMKYSGRSIIYRLFSSLYISKKCKSLIVYFAIRNCIKKLKSLIICMRKRGYNEF